MMTNQMRINGIIMEETTRIRHLLILMYAGRISVVEYKQKEYQCISFSGEKYTKLSKSFWKDLARKMTIDNTQGVDLCLISDIDHDEAMTLIDDIFKKRIVTEKSIWERSKANEAIRKLNPGIATTVFSPQGNYLFGISAFLPAVNVQKLTAWYANIINDPVDEDKNEDNISIAHKEGNPLREYMLNENKKAESRKRK